MSDSMVEIRYFTCVRFQASGDSGTKVMSNLMMENIFAPYAA